MEIAKNDRVNSLFDFYASLLTKKQYNYLQLYYADDYSLGEIAEEFSVSRQAVYDNIKRTEKILEDYEAKLHLLADFKVRNATLDRLVAYVNANYQKDAKLERLVHDLAKDEED
ncbi:MULTISPECIES: putative DNA-binding protein [Loigolactobacillus]|uniref:UPF0122 protein AYR53_09820 n=1 Tax=Loigolactobacillus backii TaxID=375175 RepID=A0A192H4X9_9LACO|nr:MULTISPECIES: putative DNA-binding protein [Loigolactobacillus]ANK59393.1 DNA-binding protein [Loigolactobacillus backii]ANK63031.1 DNA-binding protein [Loigolactobacillus backii]ANK64386.1 DNA-binding protein [Loigolactobacillus backii]ANK67218.1 DNA-binding protein [Loigolactobacillus backii]ANK69961.1 DNA-binding protein [Loigolactobacillus backii]